MREEGRRAVERDPDDLLATTERDQRVDLGDFIVVLLANLLAGLRDRLVGDGFAGAAELVADLVEVTDDYLSRIPA
jgi:hypothetical protein